MLLMELAVLVPVLNRPQNVGPLVESFLAGCPTDSELIFISQWGDDAEIETVTQFASFPEDGGRIRSHISDNTTWPQKINHGVTQVVAAWYLCAADDIRFTEGWWDATTKLRHDPRIGVIGTNDSRTGSGNPRVAVGEHTCHPLIRGDYIREQGTVDQVGQAVHPGYFHWFVDDELVATAKARHAWTYCREAVIEHLHPYWGHGEMDDTYRAGEANAEADLALWKSRAPLLGLQVQ